MFRYWTLSQPRRLLCQGGCLHDRATGRVAGALVAGFSHDIAAGWVARPLLVGLGHDVAAGRVAGSLAVGLSGRHVDWLVVCLLKVRGMTRVNRIEVFFE